MAGVFAVLLYNLQRFDAFLVDVLFQNVQRMHNAHGTSPERPVHGHISNPNQELPSWTADGFSRMDFADADVIALQVAPWTFLTSSYAISLLLMAIVINRIQHIVAPVHEVHATGLGSWRSKLLPIDPTSTRTRFLIRSISLYLLWKSLICQAIILLQAFDLYPSSSVFAPLGQSIGMLSMVDVCWSSFVAVCAAMTINTFTRSLDGSSSSSSFNLPQYAFLLHLYSSPLGSVFNRVSDPLAGKRLAPRPNRHVLVTIFLPLLQLTMLHTQGVWKRYSRDSLIPTSICGLLGLLHFAHTFWTKQIIYYPLLQLVPSGLELILVLMIAFTMGLNIVSQLLTTGRVARPLFGPGANALPSRDEEYALALVRLGTSCVDATSVAGLGNEVATVNSAKTKEGTLRLGQSEVEAIELPEYARKSTRGRRKVNPFTVEIKTIRAASNEGEMWINVIWIKELGKFGLALWKFARGVWMMVRGRRPSPPSNVDVLELIREETPPRRLSEDRQPDVYRQFLSGEAIADGDSEFEPDDDDDDHTLDSDSDGSLESRSTRSPSVEREHAEESGGLFIEHSERASTPIAPVLLAHLTTSSSSPLTRRRYSSLLNKNDQTEDGVSSAHAISRTEYSHSSPARPIDLEINHKLCVICMTSDRAIICWPCRCLSMCEDCRSNLASRTGPSRHTCPCCRQSVEGFSRIFIP